MFFTEWAGNRIGIKPVAFVFNADLEAVVIDAEGDADLLVPVAKVAVLDGVDKRFFQGLMDIEDVAVSVATFAQAVSDQLLQAARFAGIAGDDDALGQALNAE